MEPEEIRRRVAEIEWYHTIELGYGIVTPGVDPSPSRLLRLGFPADLSGKTVLDIGAWDGFFSFELERRGAARVVAVDSFSWSGSGWGTKAGFELAREVLGSHVEDRELEVLDLSPDAVGVFDVVVFAFIAAEIDDGDVEIAAFPMRAKRLPIIPGASHIEDARRPAANRRSIGQIKEPRETSPAEAVAVDIHAHVRRQEETARNSTAAASSIIRPTLTAAST